MNADNNFGEAQVQGYGTTCFLIRILELRNLMTET